MTTGSAIASGDPRGPVGAAGPVPSRVGRTPLLAAIRAVR
jgi:hypothetical protein